MTWGIRLNIENNAEAGSWTPKILLKGHLPWNWGTFRPSLTKASTVSHMQLYLQSSKQLHWNKDSKNGWLSWKCCKLSLEEHLDSKQVLIQCLWNGDASPAEALTSKTLNKMQIDTKTDFVEHILLLFSLHNIDKSFKNTFFSFDFVYGFFFLL